jgi:hypothetical protein
MTIKEFIEQVGAVARAPPRTKDDNVGVCEIIEIGDGIWQKGTAFFKGDAAERLEQSLGDVGWDEVRGEAGKGKPIWLALLP